MKFSRFWPRRRNWSILLENENRLDRTLMELLWQQLTWKCTAYYLNKPLLLRAYHFSKYAFVCIFIILRTITSEYWICILAWANIHTHREVSGRVQVTFSKRAWSSTQKIKRNWLKRRGLNFHCKLNSCFFDNIRQISTFVILQVFLWIKTKENP